MTIKSGSTSLNLFAKSDFFNYYDFGGNSGDYKALNERKALGQFAVVAAWFHWFMDDAVAFPGTSICNQVESRRSSFIDDRIHAS